MLFAPSHHADGVLSWSCISMAPVLWCTRKRWRTFCFPLYKNNKNKKKSTQAKLYVIQHTIKVFLLTISSRIRWSPGRSRLRAALAVGVRLGGAAVWVWVPVVLILRRGLLADPEVCGAEASEQALVVEPPALLSERVLWEGLHRSTGYDHRLWLFGVPVPKNTSVLMFYQENVIV